MYLLYYISYIIYYTIVLLRVYHRVEDEIQRGPVLGVGGIVIVEIPCIPRNTVKVGTYDKMR